MRLHGFLKSRWLLLTALIFAACSTGPIGSKPTAADAEKFIAEAEKRALAVSIKTGRASWLRIASAQTLAQAFDSGYESIRESASKAPRQEEERRGLAHRAAKPSRSKRPC